jgi:hypothetical protein
MSELSECLLPTRANRMIGTCHASLRPGDDGQPDLPSGGHAELPSGGQLDYLV